MNLLTEIQNFFLKTHPSIIQRNILSLNQSNECIVDQLARISYFLDDYGKNHLYANLTKIELLSVLEKIRDFQKKAPKIEECQMTFKLLQSESKIDTDFENILLDESNHQKDLSPFIELLSKNRHDPLLIIKFFLVANSISRKFGLIELEKYFPLLQECNLEFFKLAVKMATNGFEPIRLSNILAYELKQINPISRDLIIEGSTSIISGDNNQILYAKMYCKLRQYGEIDSFKTQ
jgi:hypothetical protein